MHATFVELPPFQRLRDQYFDDDSFRELQTQLMENPEAGDLIKGTGGLRKIRYLDARRGKGKRGGLRVIYFWRGANKEFWMFLVFDKDEADDLTAEQRHTLRNRLYSEIKARSNGT